MRAVTCFTQEHELTIRDEIKKRVIISARARKRVESSRKIHPFG
jgi:hypothetical protein